MSRARKLKKVVIDWNKAVETKWKVPIAEAVKAYPAILKDFRETHLTKPRSVV